MKKSLPKKMGIWTSNYKKMLKTVIREIKIKMKHHCICSKMTAKQKQNPDV